MPFGVLQDCGETMVKPNEESKSPAPVEVKADTAMKVKLRSRLLKGSVAISCVAIVALAIVGLVTYIDLKDLQFEPSKIHFENPEGAPRALLLIDMEVLHGPKLHRIGLEGATCRARDGSGTEVLHTRLAEAWQYPAESGGQIVAEVVKVSSRFREALAGKAGAKGFAVECNFDVSLSIFGTSLVMTHSLSKGWSNVATESTTMKSNTDAERVVNWPAQKNESEKASSCKPTRQNSDGEQPPEITL